MSNIFDIVGGLSMSFREVSAWVMAALMTATGLYYLSTYQTAAKALGASPPMQAFIPYAIVVVIASIIVQAALASFAPKSAERTPDERERPALWRAGHWAGLLQAGLCICALLYTIHTGDLALLFHLIVGGLILAQIAEYGLQIVFLRLTA